MSFIDEIEAEQAEAEKNIAGTKAFMMNLKYTKRFPDPVIMIDGNKVMDFGEIMALVALPSTGKSQIVEMIACAWAAKINGISVDSFGFEFPNDDKRKVLLVDTERTMDDCREGLDRMYRRMGLPSHIVDENGYINGLDFAVMEGLDTEQLKSELDRLMEKTAYGLVIIDGILDFATSLNDDKDSKALVKDYFRTKAGKHGCGMICTIHPNKGTENIAGHLGAFLYRWCRACLLIRKATPSIREITTDFPQGKMSKANNPVNVFFSWSDMNHMMMPCDAPDDGENKKLYNTRALNEVFTSLLFQGKSSIAANDLKELYAKKIGGKSLSTAEKHIRQAVEEGFLLCEGSTNNRVYRLSDSD